MGSRGASAGNAAKESQFKKAESDMLAARKAYEAINSEWLEYMASGKTSKKKLADINRRGDEAEAKYKTLFNKYAKLAGYGEQAMLK